MKSLDDRLLERSRSIMDRAAVLLQKVNPNFVAAATMLGSLQNSEKIVR